MNDNNSPAPPETVPPPAVDKPAPASHAARSGLFRPVLGLVIVVFLFVLWRILTSYVIYTDDAYVRSDLVALAPQVTGHLAVISVVDDQEVRRGDLLAQIDPTPFQLAVNSAQAALQGANADAKAARDATAAAQDQLDRANAVLPDAEITEQRAASLGREGFASGAVQDNALAALRGAQASVANRQAMLADAQAQFAAKQSAVALAQANLATAQWQLARTAIQAPVDGIVTNFNLQLGDTAQADVPLIGIVAARNWRIIANVKQGYLAGLHPGDTAWVWLDADPGHFFRARVRSIGRAISRQQGDDGLLPYVAPTTDWIRLQHRFPVTLDLVNPPPGLVLYMGADARCVIFR